jgi:hypothetical protein
MQTNTKPLESRSDAVGPGCIFVCPELLLPTASLINCNWIDNRRQREANSRWTPLITFDRTMVSLFSHQAAALDSINKIKQIRHAGQIPNRRNDGGLVILHKLQFIWCLFGYFTMLHHVLSAECTCRTCSRLWTMKGPSAGVSSGGHSMSSEPNFQHSDPRMKLSICETKTMNSVGDFFQNFKKVGFLKIQISKILWMVCAKNKEEK